MAIFTLSHLINVALTKFYQFLYSKGKLHQMQKLTVFSTKQKCMFFFINNLTTTKMNNDFPKEMKMHIISAFLAS